MPPITTVEILAVGTELTTGSTRDTNSGDLAKELTDHGVRVLRVAALPDELEVVATAFRDGIMRADMVISTGGLGPTPDDLTREAIAAACDQEPFVDADLEKWLRGLFERRGIAMPELNRKQAWLIEGAESLPNAHGSAPGWYLARRDGKVIVALPGPPREMRPMWRDHALPRLEERGLGVSRVVQILRLSGIGESQIAEIIGEDVLRATRPQVATYARMDAVDVVVSVEDADHALAQRQVDDMVARLRAELGHWVFTQGDGSWPDAIAERLAGRKVAVVELGTAGQLTQMLGDAEFLTFAELLRDPHDLTRAATDLGHYAERVREVGQADIGLAVLARETHGDTHLRVAISTNDESHEEKRVAFLGGSEGRRRAALSACAAFWAWLGERPT
ncbi:MAG TPA: competence/damage-inducible protein A [Candidatus Limnocylindrales bacterium]|nr:competence/damage-inducible protein A [Candidatus Limnocylindrales bacterium]